MTYYIEDALRAYRLAISRRGVTRTTLNAIEGLRAAFGRMDLARLGDEDIHAYRQLRHYVSDATVRRELSVLVAAINHAARKNLLPPGVRLPSIDLPPHGAPRTEYLNAKEEADFWDLVAFQKGAKDQDLYVFCALALRTGARRGAILGLTRDRVDFDARVIDYRDPSARATKKRRVPVPMDNQLEQSLIAAGVYKMKPGQRVIGVSDIGPKWRDLVSGTPWEGRVTPHVLRHTAASRWLRQGVSIWNVAGLLGDTIETVSKVYGHHDTEALRKAIA